MTIRLQIELFGWVAEKYTGERGRLRARLTREVPAGATVRDVLTALALEAESFRQWVYDPAAGVLGEDVQVVLGDRLLDLLPGRLDTPLADGAELALVTAFSGG